VDRLPTIRKGNIAKVEGEKFKLVLFEHWLIDNQIEEYIIHVHYHLAFNFFYFIEAQLMRECNDKTMNKKFEFITMDQNANTFLITSILRTKFQAITKCSSPYISYKK